ncbi:MAG: M15 family metallopeptidase [Lachnospiraceae bacterium]|nr:M15 family metallopeptidase [Lachnospiraceae bacterium]
MVGGAISGFLILICAFLALCIKIGFYGGYADNGTAISREISRETAVIITDTLPWNLILVNKWNPLPEEFEVEFTLLSNGQRVDKRIYPDLQAMFDDARAEGVFPVVREGFRTHDEQTKIFDDKVKAFMKEGHRRKKAEELAEKWVAVPGSSEHELGLAVDINADKERSTNEEVYSWLAENAWRYGFILRYPYGSESITGIDYEPWHYRFVGKDAAAIIYETGVTLEEYDKSLQL